MYFWNTPHVTVQSGIPLLDLLVPLVTATCLSCAVIQSSIIYCSNAEKSKRSSPACKVTLCFLSCLLLTVPRALWKMSCRCFGILMIASGRDAGFSCGKSGGAMIYSLSSCLIRTVSRGLLFLWGMSVGAVCTRCAFVFLAANITFRTTAEH